MRNPPTATATTTATHTHTHTHTHTATSHSCGLRLLWFHQPALCIFICHSVSTQHLLLQWFSSVTSCSVEIRHGPSWYVLYMIFLYVSYTLNIQRRSHLAWAPNVFTSHQSVVRLLQCYLETYLKTWAVSWNMSEIGPENVASFIQQKLSVYILPYSPIPTGWGSGHSDPHIRERLNKECHNDTVDNGTMEVLSITALSLEKSSQKGVSLVTLSHVFLFILTFKSVFL